MTRIFGAFLARFFGIRQDRTGRTDGTEIQFCSTIGPEKYSFAVLLGRSNFNSFSRKNKKTLLFSVLTPFLGPIKGGGNVCYRLPYTWVDE